MRRSKRRKRNKTAAVPKAKSDEDAFLDEAMAQAQSEADEFLQHINMMIDEQCPRGQACPEGHRLRAGRAQVHGHCGFCGMDIQCEAMLVCCDAFGDDGVGCGGMCEACMRNPNVVGVWRSGAPPQR